MSEGFEKVGSLDQLVCGFSIPVWLWRIACFTTDFHSFLTGNWLFAVNVRKCCSKLYLIIKFHAGPSGIQKKAFRHCLLSRITLIRNCQNLDYIAFQKIKFSFIDFWNDGMNAKHTFTQVGSGWNFKSLNIFHHTMLKFT